jgi:hypothetical protein
VGNNGSELIRQLTDAGLPVRALTGIEQAYIVTPVHPVSVIWFYNFFDAARTAGVRRLI